MNKKPLLLTIGALLISIVAGVAILIFSNSQPANNTQNLSSELREPPSGGEFQVDSINGPVKLSDFKGKGVIVYFGYTLCPDICPTSLGFLGLALNQLTEDELAEVQGIFISVDPDRDKLEHLDNYAKYFHQNLIGATSNKAVIDDIVHRYGAAYRMVNTESSLGYLVDHSAAIYFIDKNGKLVKSLPHGTPPSEIVATLRELIGE